MIFGITLKEYQRILAKGESYKGNFWINKQLLKQSNKKFRTKDISKLKFSEFVDCENYIETADFKNFCNIFVKPFQMVYVHNLKTIVQDYADQKAKLFENYPYIFNPPSYGEVAPDTVGSELRKDFVKEFGSWVILTDLVCKGNIVNYKTVEGWAVEEFLFWANYLSGQRILENVK